MKLIILLMIFLEGCNFSYKKNKLDDPIISLEENKIVWDIIKNASAYKIYLNDNFIEEISLNYYELSKLDIGSYEIKIKAINNKKESNFSNIIIYEKKQKLEAVRNINIKNNNLTFEKDTLNKALIYINGIFYLEIEENFLNLPNLNDGDIISIILIQEGYDDSDKIDYEYHYLDEPKNLVVNNNILYYDKVNNANSYNIYLNNELLTNTTNNYYKLDILIDGTYIIEVEAVNEYNVSLKTKFIYDYKTTLKIIDSPKVKLENGYLVWDIVVGAIGYKISIDNSNYIDIGNVNEYNTEIIKNGSHKINLISVSSNPLYNSIEFTGEFVKLDVPKNVFINDQNISWYSVINASSYQVKIVYSDDVVDIIDTIYTSIIIDNPNIKEVSVKAFSPGFLCSDYSSSFDIQNDNNKDFYLGIGSRKRPFIISSYIHLLNMNKYLNQNKYFELNNDIDLNGNEWIPFDLEFNGFFNGNNYKIFNFVIENNQQETYFIKSSSGNIKNLNLDYKINLKENNVNINGLLLTNNGVLENLNLNLNISLTNPKNVIISGFTNSNLSLGSIIDSSYNILFSLNEYSNLENLKMNSICLNNEGFINNINGSLNYTNSFNNLKGDLDICLGATNNLGIIENINVDGNLKLNGDILNKININVSSISLNNLSKIHNAHSKFNISINITNNNYLENIFIYGISKNGKIFNSTYNGDVDIIGNNINVFGIGGDEISNCNCNSIFVFNSFNGDINTSGIAYNPVVLNNSNFEGTINLKGDNINCGGLVVFNNKMDFSYFIGEIYITGNNISVGGLSAINNGLIEYCDSTINIITNSSKLVKSGGITGINYGHIKDCNSITNMDVTADELYLGGIVGENNKLNNVIEKTYSSNNIKSNGNICYLGGITGINNGGVIKVCYSIGVLSAPTKTMYCKSGGLVGFNTENSVISNCYSIVNIEQSFYAGGLIGHNKGYINYCYSLGRVEANAYAGGLVGYNEGNIIDSFYDIEKSNQTDTNKGIGLTTEQMNSPGIFITWPKFISLDDLNSNINNVWIFNEGSLPKLYFQ